MGKETCLKIVVLVFVSIGVIGGGVASSHALPRAPGSSRKLPAPTPQPIEEGISRQIDDVFAKALSALVEQRADDFRALLSSSTLERETRGAGVIDKIIKERFIPFFYDFHQLTSSAASLPTEDPEGHKGLALCRSFETKDHREKPFVIYIVQEEGKFVVSNLLLNKRLIDISLEADKL